MGHFFTKNFFCFLFHFIEEENLRVFGNPDSFFFIDFSIKLAQCISLTPYQRTVSVLHIQYGIFAPDCYLGQFRAFSIYRSTGSSIFSFIIRTPSIRRNSRFIEKTNIRLADRNGPTELTVNPNGMKSADELFTI